MKKKIALVLFSVPFALGVWWAWYLKEAHSSLENYARFRGCTEIVERTEFDAQCLLSSGKTIRLVQQNKKWYLEGDLPY